MGRVSDSLSAPRDLERHRVLSGSSRVQALELLRAEGRPAGIAEVAARLDLHPNTVRLHLDQLVGAGLVTRERESRGRPGRPRMLYEAVPTADGPDVTSGRAGAEDSRYEMLAEALVVQLERTASEPAVEAVAAGDSWGRDLVGDATTAPTTQQATADLVDLLDDVGFAPRISGPDRAIELHRCPFGRLAREHSPVVCGVHLGLMQGALAARSAPLRVSGLDPFVTPGVCLAHLEAAEPPFG